MSSHHPHQNVDYRNLSDLEIQEMAHERASETGEDPSRVLAGMKAMRTRQEKADSSTFEVAQRSFSGMGDENDEQGEQNDQTTNDQFY